jgi:two-component sensor histidine kinase
MRWTSLGNDDRSLPSGSGPSVRVFVIGQAPQVGRREVDPPLDPVSLRREAKEGYVLTVTDDGTGLPADFDPASTPGFGMKMIVSFAGQLGGELRFGGASSASGANFGIRVAKIPVAQNL